MNSCHKLHLLRKKKKKNTAPGAFTEDVSRLTRVCSVAGNWLAVFDGSSVVVDVMILRSRDVGVTDGIGFLVVIVVVSSGGLSVL